MLGGTVVDFGVKLPTGLAAGRANTQYFDGADVTIVAKLVVDPQVERGPLASTTAQPRVWLLLDHVEPEVGTVEQEVIASALQTFCGTDTFVLQNGDLELLATTVGTDEIYAPCLRHF